MHTQSWLGSGIMTQVEKAAELRESLACSPDGPAASDVIELAASIKQRMSSFTGWERVADLLCVDSPENRDQPRLEAHLKLANKLGAHLQQPVSWTS